MTFLRRVVMLSRSRKFGRYPEARWANCAFGTIQASIALLVLLSLVHPSRSFAANPDLETVLTGSRQRIEKLDYRVTGRLTRVEGRWQAHELQVCRQGSLVSRWSASAMRDLGAWLREDEPSSAYEREWARDHRGGTSWREGR